MGNRREVFRFLAPRLAQAGYRVVAADMRGHGESSMGWPSVTGTSAISRADVAGDLLALIRHAGGPAVIVGHSLSGGAATIAAAAEPGLVSGIVEINPFTRVQRLDVGALLRIRRCRQGFIRLLGTQLFHSLRWWLRYLDLAYPSKPADYAQYMAGLAAKLSEPAGLSTLRPRTRAEGLDRHGRGFLDLVSAAHRRVRDGTRQPTDGRTMPLFIRFTGYAPSVARRGVRPGETGQRGAGCGRPGCPRGWRCRSRDRCLRLCALPDPAQRFGPVDPAG